MRDEDDDLGSNVNAECIIPSYQRLAHVEHALSLGLPEIDVVRHTKGHVAIVGTGPSVRECIATLRLWKGPVWAANGALGLLLDHHIVPDAWVSVDPMTDIVAYLDRTPHEVTYYPASVCHPAVFERLKGCPKVKLWHTLSDVPLPETFLQIGGGSTTATRAPMLAYALGYKRVSLFGVDSSWDDDSAFHGDGRGVPTTGRIADETVTVEMNGKTYRTSRALISQATYLGYLKQRFPGKLEVRGRGLAPDLVRDLKSRH